MKLFSLRFEANPDDDTLFANVFLIYADCAVETMQRCIREAKKIKPFSDETLIKVLQKNKITFQEAHPIELSFENGNKL